jgi:curli biogenesis system outer membrane secretion channel CsgG
MPSGVNLSHITRVAVVPFDNDSNDRIASRLGAMLQETGAFEIMERAQFDKLVNEFQFSMSGLVDESTAAQVGEALGVEALIYGTILVNRVRDEETSEKVTWTEAQKYTNSKGKKKTRYVSKETMAGATLRRGDLEISLKVVDVAGGIILVQLIELFNKSETKIHHSEAKQVTLTSSAVIEREMVADALRSFIRHVVPFNEPVVARIDESCGNKRCTKALKMLQLEMFDEAQALYAEQRTVYEASTKKREKDRGKDTKLAAVYYNLGLISEMNGEMEEAIDLYRQAIVLRIDKPAKKMTNALARVRDCTDRWAVYHDQAQ